MNFSSLPMYDLPELTRATDAWWDGLARHMRTEGISDVPDTRSRPLGDSELLQHWTSPTLLFSQTCGYPLTHALAGRVRLLALPVYACDGCGSDGFYSSMIVVPAQSKVYSIADCRSARAVYNSDDSMSGLLALHVAAARVAATADSPLFSDALRSGAHTDSLRALAEGRAEVAAIDPVSYALLAKTQPDLIAGTRVIGRSPSVPGLPYITSLRHDDEVFRKLRRALKTAFADPALAGTRAELMLADVVFPEPLSYGVILEMEREAAKVPFV